MTTLLAPVQGMKVLEIGTGSGYQAAVLCELGMRVFTIERHALLLLEARKRLESLGYRVAAKAGDGPIGWSEFAPYDRIIVTAAAPRVPDALVKQLVVGGLLVVPVGSLRAQQLFLVEKTQDSAIVTEMKEFYFVPLIGKGGWDSTVEK